MRKPRSSSFLPIASGILMMLALCWLTISTPYVYAAEKAIKKEVKKESIGCDETDPFSNTTEEKSESSTTSISEYLIDLLHHEQTFMVIVKSYKTHSADLYFAFQPELISPPPDAVYS